MESSKHRLQMINHKRLLLRTAYFVFTMFLALIMSPHIVSSGRAESLPEMVKKLRIEQSRLQETVKDLIGRINRLERKSQKENESATIGRRPQSRIGEPMVSEAVLPVLIYHFTVMERAKVIERAVAEAFAAAVKPEAGILAIQRDYVVITTHLSGLDAELVRRFARAQALDPIDGQWVAANKYGGQRMVWAEATALPKQDAMTLQKYFGVRFPGRDEPRRAWIFLSGGDTAK